MSMENMHMLSTAKPLTALTPRVSLALACAQPAPKRGSDATDRVGRVRVASPPEQSIQPESTPKTSFTPRALLKKPLSTSQILGFLEGIQVFRVSTRRLSGGFQGSKEFQEAPGKPKKLWTWREPLVSYSNDFLSEKRGVGHR